MEKTTIELQDELTSLIGKKTQNINIVNIDELIDNKRKEIMEALEEVKKA